MKLPKVTNEELVIIQKAANKVASNSWIPGYDTDDIKQEAIIIGIKGIRKYNGATSLEIFLINHIKNRLRSLRRKLFIRPGCDCGKCVKCRNNEAKSKISNPASLENVSGDKKLEYSFEDIVEQQELVEYLDSVIPEELRVDYLKFLAGIPIASNKKLKIKKYIDEYGE